MVPVPQSKSEINRGGALLRAVYGVPLLPQDQPKRARALSIAEEYRLQHAYALELVTAGLSSMAKSEFGDAAVGQRLKRMPAIVYKLRRYEKMQLARMQDIGGCRAVLAEAAQVDGVMRRIRKQKWGVVRIGDYRTAENVAPELRWIRGGRLKLVATDELREWTRRNGERIEAGR